MIRDTSESEVLRAVILDPTEARTRQKKWLIGLGLLSILMVLAGYAGLWTPIKAGVDEVNAMEPWPAPGSNLEQVIAVDMSHVGLQMDGFTWIEQYRHGQVAFRSGENQVLGIEGLRFDSKDHDYGAFTFAADWAEGNCRRYSYVNVASKGVIRCDRGGVYVKNFWNDYWIVQISTGKWGTSPQRSW